MEKEYLIRRCCVCRTVELNGKMVRFGDVGNMGDEGYRYSDGVFSYGCLVKQYGKEMAERINKNGTFNVKECSTLEDFSDETE